MKLSIKTSLTCGFLITTAVMGDSELSEAAPSGVALEFINTFDVNSLHPRNSDPSKWNSGSRQMKEVWWNTAFYFCNYAQDVTASGNTCSVSIKNTAVSVFSKFTVTGATYVPDVCPKHDNGYNTL